MRTSIHTIRIREAIEIHEKNKMKTVNILK